ncbi:MAG: hypothetical protein ACI8QS_003632 [Planctomycetota bacterium]|jgi:hypothetical protein
MRLLLTVLACLGTFGGVTQAQASEHSSPSLDLAQLAPPSTLVFVDLGGISPVLEEGLEHPLIEMLLDSELGEQLLSQSPLTPEDALALGQATLGRAVLPTLAGLTDGGVIFSLSIKRGKPTFLVAASGKEAAFTRSALEDGLRLVAKEFGVSEASILKPQGSMRGLDAWFLGDDFAICTSGNLLLISNDEGSLREAADRLVDGAGASLVDNAGFGEARHDASGTQPSLWSWVDVDALETQDTSATADLRALVESIPAHFIFGPALASIGAAKQTTAALTLGEAGIELVVEARGLGNGPAAMVLPTVGDAPELRVPVRAKDSARGLLYRDLAGLFLNRNELFTAKAQPQFAEATSGLALFFGGEDISDKVLPAISPWLEFVISDPIFTNGATPDIPLPAAAIVAQVDAASDVGNMLISAFQTAIGIMNIEGAQQMQPQLQLGLELVSGVNLTSAHYPKPVEGDGVDMRFNLEPACALVGDRFIVGTHRSLVADLVRKLTGEGGDGAKGQARVGSPGESIQLTGSAFARAIRANASALALNSSLEDGKELAVAQGEIEGVAMVGDLIERLTLQTRRPAEGRVRVSLKLELVR